MAGAIIPPGGVIFRSCALLGEKYALRFGPGAALASFPARHVHGIDPPPIVQCFIVQVSVDDTVDTGRDALNILWVRIEFVQRKVGSPSDLIVCMSGVAAAEKLPAMLFCPGTGLVEIMGSACGHIVCDITDVVDRPRPLVVPWFWMLTDPRIVHPIHDGCHLQLRRWGHGLSLGRNGRDYGANDCCVYNKQQFVES
jgi:hypothetical protein